MAQYHARLGKPLDQEFIENMEDSLCQRFEAVIRRHGVSTFDYKLRNLLAKRKVQQRRYQQCMETYNFPQYCSKFINF